MTLSLANHHASLPVGYRLYLPKEWAEDEPRRKQAGVPDDVVFETKPAIALGLLKQALARRLARAGSCWRTPATGRIRRSARR